MAQLSSTSLAQSRTLVEIFQRVETAILQGVALAEVVGLKGDEALIGAGGGKGLKRGELLWRDEGPRLVILVVGLLLVLLIGWGLVGCEFAFRELVLGATLALALPGAVLGGRIGEEGVLLEEGQQVVVGVAHQ